MRSHQLLAVRVISSTCSASLRAPKLALLLIDSGVSEKIWYSSIIV